MSEESKTKDKNCSEEKRRKFYAITVIASIVIISIIGLLSIWDVGLNANFTVKTVISLCILAVLSMFLYTLTYNHDKKIVKQLGYITGIAATAISVLIMGQIWCDMLNEIIFGKIIVTLIIIGGLAGFGIAMSSDFFESKKLKDENYLD